MSKTPLIKIPLIDTISREIRNYEDTLLVNNSKVYVCPYIIPVEDYIDSELSRVMRYYPSSYFLEIGCYKNRTHRDIKRAREKENITVLRVKTITIGKSTRVLDKLRPKNWWCY